MNTPLSLFLNKIIDASLSDKTWLFEQDNLRKEAIKLKEEITGVKDEEVKIDLVASKK